MIEEYALVPDVFDPARYSNPAYIDMCLPHLKEALLQDSIVRDLGGGAWSKSLRTCEGTPSYHRRTEELLKRLEKEKRLRPSPLQSASTPGEPVAWCQEALQTRSSKRLSGVIAAHATKVEFAKEDAVASIEKLLGCNWWQQRSCSRLMKRETVAFLETLSRVLEYANSMMFIDPYLDPKRQNYEEFYRLLEPLAGRRPAVPVELHRNSCLRDGGTRSYPSKEEWRDRFASLHQKLDSLGLSAEVFFWQDFHWRFLITDLVGISAEAGFDVTKNGQQTIWTRLSRADREKIQKQFDVGGPQSRVLKFRFYIGAESEAER
jgi:hypothetical protein